MQGTLKVPSPAGRLGHARAVLARNHARSRTNECGAFSARAFCTKARSHDPITLPQGVLPISPRRPDVAQPEVLDLDVGSQDEAKRNPGSLRAPNPIQDFNQPTNGLSNLNHLEIFFAGAAFRASPVKWHIAPGGSRRNIVFGVARLLVINPATNQAHPGC